MTFTPVCTFGCVSLRCSFLVRQPGGYVTVVSSLLPSWSPQRTCSSCWVTGVSTELACSVLTDLAALTCNARYCPTRVSLLSMVKKNAGAIIPPDFQTSRLPFLFFCVFSVFFVQGQKVSRDLVPVVTSRKPVVTSDPSRKSSKTLTK